jgi:SAM-dependent methyltransferase
MANSYSRTWFSTFLGTIDAGIVEKEVAFLERQLPLGDCSRVVDVCCGPGRHLAPLATCGYQVIGVDRDLTALTDARQRARGACTASFVEADMSALPLSHRAFDAAICMWQSFGHFGEDGDRTALAQMHRVVREGGRVILDVYNRDFHERQLGTRTFQREDVSVTEHRVMVNGRLRVHLRYDRPGAPPDSDEFEWTLYDATRLAALGRSVGLTCMVACAAFDEVRPVTGDEPRMQLVFRRD